MQNTIVMIFLCNCKEPKESTLCRCPQEDLRIEWQHYQPHISLNIIDGNSLACSQDIWRERFSSRGRREIRSSAESVITFASITCLCFAGKSASHTNAKIYKYSSSAKSVITFASITGQSTTRAILGPAKWNLRPMNIKWVLRKRLLSADQSSSLPHVRIHPFTEKCHILIWRWMEYIWEYLEWLKNMAPPSRKGRTEISFIILWTDRSDRMIITLQSIV